VGRVENEFGEEYLILAFVHLRASAVVVREESPMVEVQDASKCETVSTSVLVIGHAKVPWKTILRPDLLHASCSRRILYPGHGGLVSRTMNLHMLRMPFHLVAVEEDRVLWCGMSKSSKS
jgi:hypothetical protein